MSPRLGLEAVLKALGGHALQQALHQRVHLALLHVVRCQRMARPRRLVPIAYSCFTLGNMQLPQGAARRPDNWFGEYQGGQAEPRLHEQREELGCCARLVLLIAVHPLLYRSTASEHLKAQTVMG